MSRAIIAASRTAVPILRKSPPNKPPTGGQPSRRSANRTPRKCGAVMSPPNKEGATPARKRGEGGAPQALPPLSKPPHPHGRWVPNSEDGGSSGQGCPKTSGQRDSKPPRVRTHGPTGCLATIQHHASQYTNAPKGQEHVLQKGLKYELQHSVTSHAEHEGQNGPSS